MQKRTPFQRDASRHGRKGKGSMEGERHGAGCGGMFHCVVGPTMVKNRGLVPDVVNNICDKCGAESVTDEEWNHLQREKQSMTEALVKAKQAAAFLQISERKLWELTNSHEIPCVRIGRSVRYDPVDLRKYIECRKAGA